MATPRNSVSRIVTSLLLVSSLGILITSPLLGEQSVYKCETDQGVEFSPQPCSEDADKVSARDGSGGIVVLDGDEIVGESKASAYDGVILKNLSGQVRDNKFWLHDAYLTKKSPQANCGEWIDRNGMLVWVPCNE